MSLFDDSGVKDDRHTLTGYRILEEQISGDECILQFENHWADGSSHTFPQRYVRMGNDWRQALDFDEPAQGKLS